MIDATSPIEVGVDRSLDSASLNELLRFLLFKINGINSDIVSLSARVSATETAIALADRIVKSDLAEMATSYPNYFVIGANHSALSFPEFYHVEYNEDGECTRWTGPERSFSFSFFLDRTTGGEFKLEFERACFLEPLEALACYVDGQSVPLSIGKVTAGFDATGVLPVRRDKGGTVITFVCPSVRTPQEEGSEDSRSLGIRFQRFTAQTGVHAAPGS